MLQTEQVLQSHYRLVQQLSQNAGRQTWLAEDERSHTPVVVKLLTFNDQVQWDNLRLFEREAQVLRQLDHPQIPRYRDYFCIDDQMLWFGLVQTYIPGVSLKERLATGKTLSEKQARKLAVEVLQILIYLHGLSPPVLHRDIKPSNLIRGDDKQIYLVDFGSVQDRAAAEGATFTVVGTYGYAPLEQFGGRATPASDLYALGTTLIHLLTGTAPADLPQLDGRLQFADQVDLNPGFIRWLGRLTEPNLDRRFRTAAEALEALEANERAGSAIATKQPLDSNIQIQKSPDYLKIKFPVRSLEILMSPKHLATLAWLTLWVGLTLLFSLTLSISVLSGTWLQLFAWIIIGILIGGRLISALIEVEVCFDHRHFQMDWRLFGLQLLRRRGQVAEIDQVFESETFSPHDIRIKVPEVTFAIGIRECSFHRLNPPLTQAECQWLVEEIKSWLGLK